MQLRGHRTGPRETAGQGGWVMVYSGEESQGATVRTSAPLEPKTEQGEHQRRLAMSPSRSPHVPSSQNVNVRGPSSPYSAGVPNFVCKMPPAFSPCFNGGQGVEYADYQSGLQVPVGALPSSQYYVAHETPAARPTSSPNIGLPKSQLAGSKPTKRKYSKRSQSVATVDSRDSDEYDEGRKKRKVVTEASSTFYIGDFPKVIDFLYHRFDELTTKPLRTMVTNWIKILEPRRQSNYGPYHKQLPSDQPSGSTPPWWPQSVPYNEPSHLSKHNLNVLAVDVMLQHRKIDEVKRKHSWVDKLQKAAEYAVETTPVEFFSSSKNLAFNTKMRERALKSLLPSLFDVAQSYENHVTMHALYEGSGTTDPGTGRKHTWQIISKPPREVIQRKHAYKSKRRPTLKTNCDAEKSGGDEKGSPAQSRQADVKSPKQSTSHTGVVLQRSREASEPVAVAGPSPPSTPQNLSLRRSDMIPKTSYKRPQHNPYPSRDLYVNVKGPSPHQYAEQALFHNNNNPPNQSIQPYTSSFSMFPPFQHHENSSPDTDSPLSITSGISLNDFPPYTLIGSSYPFNMSNQMCGSIMVTSNAGYPYSFNGLVQTSPMLGHAAGSPHEFTNEFDAK